MIIYAPILNPIQAFGMRCGYDFREANATSVTEEIRKDLKGVYTNDIMIDGKIHASDKNNAMYLVLLKLF